MMERYTLVVAAVEAGAPAEFLHARIGTRGARQIRVSANVVRVRRTSGEIVVKRHKAGTSVASRTIVGVMASGVERRTGRHTTMGGNDIVFASGRLPVDGPETIVELFGA